jgi:heme oxygenase (biliverdin-producing, ferredoxin)
MPGTGATLPERLRHETRELHAATERSGAMAALLAGRLPRAGYHAMLRNLHALYAALEAALHAPQAHPALALLPVHHLARSAALAEDLSSLHGPDWAAELPLLDAARDYAQRLRALAAAQSALPVAHAYVRFLGDLHGGQVLRRLVARHFGLSGEAGTRFYDFGAEAQVLAQRQALRQALGGLPLDAGQQDAVVAEARWAFVQHQRLFEELAAA